MYPKRQYTNTRRFGMFCLLGIFVYKTEESEHSWGIDYARPPLFSIPVITRQKSIKFGMSSALRLFIFYMY